MSSPAGKQLLSSVLQPTACARARRHSTARLVLGAVLLAYVLGYVFFPIGVILIGDEGAYMAQAVAYAHGMKTVSILLPGKAVEAAASRYPPGTALLEAPFVRLGGWQAARWAALASLIVTVVVLIRWLEEEGLNPLFALMFIAYPPTLLFSRIAMSDLPSAATVALGLWLFWRGRDRHWWYWMLGGFVASASTLFRESNVLLFLPLFAGALFRGERKWRALLVGGTIGAGLRVALTTWMFGAVFYLKDPGYGWSVAAAIHTLPLYLPAMLVFVPGGLLAVFLYRGRRRPEVIATVFLFFLFYVFYTYSAEESGPVKRLLIGPRYFIPLLPLLVFVLAEVGPRAWTTLAGRLPASINPPRTLRVAVRTAIIAAIVAAFVIHPALARWAKADEAAVRVIYSHTPQRAIIVADPAAMKYLSPLYGERVVLGGKPLDEAGRLATSGSPAYLVFLDRSDSAYFRALLQENETNLAAAAAKCDLQPVDNLRIDASRRLRIWQLRSCR